MTESSRTPAVILVIEDDRQIRRVVQGYLEQAGHRVLTASDGETGLALAFHEKPNLIVLDLMLPGISGWEITQRLRRSRDPALATVYIIMLTARVEEADRVQGLSIGADDYVVKPFSPRELTARVEAALRRLDQAAMTAGTQTLVHGELRLDPVHRTVTLEGAALDLTPAEFDLLYALMRQPGRPFTRNELLDVLQAGGVGGEDAFPRTIDAHIKNLRRKLGDSGRRNRFIETVHGVGYRLTRR
ncbi:MAG: response regulator transcription factor [Caldilinea sp.]|uniref:response regulator transcription factor n=1 Tax=Caldilinea sp. TaxID=2293560 RepID=UPI0030B5BF55